MRKGNLAAYGTPLELKSQYGSALQFTMLVSPEDVIHTQTSIIRHFQHYQKFTSMQAGDAGNITLKISSVASEDRAGVDVQTLTDFVEWIENKELSGVTEYGFSNSSLEEVFLAVTDAEDEEPPSEHDERGGCCGCLCCCHRPNNTEIQEDALAINESHAESASFDDYGLSTFTPVLSTWRQAWAVLRFSFVRNWVGNGAKASWIFHLFFTGLAVMLVVRGTNSSVVAPFVVGPTVLLSMGLVSFVSPIYRDRNSGVFYLMRTQGLLKSGYVIGMGVYSFLVQLLFGIVLLSLVFTTGMFSEPDICPLDNQEGQQGYFDSYCQGDTWTYKRVARATPVRLLHGGNNEVSLYATWQSGGYVKILFAALAFALTTPGAVFSSAYVPGFKFAVTFIVVATIVSSMGPLIAYFMLGLENGYESCISDICNMSADGFTEGVTGEKFLDCVGLEVNNGALGSLCIPAKAAILPQFGLFQMLSMTLLSDITFVSDPPEYVEETLIPALGDGVKCSGATCRFPYAQELYGKTLAFTVLGGILLLVLGFSFVSFFSFPDRFSLRVRNYLSYLYKGVRALGSRSREAKQASDAEDKSQPFEEVEKESELVDAFVRNFRKSRGDEEVEEGELSRETLPPVLCQSLRKVYPALGGRPPKVALASLDLHVPKGQVLGLLGQNGAGKRLE